MRYGIWERLRQAAAILLLVSMLLTMVQAAELDPDSAEAETDATAFGSAVNITTLAWVNNAISTADCKALLNAQKLHPQHTGWKELDNLIASMLAPYTGKDTYTQLRAMYDWLVKNVTYSWDGYSKPKAPAYEYFTELDYLESMNYTTCMAKSIPDDMANRTMHILSQKKGVCYDYAIAFAVICRYIGIESYVRTGYFTLETGGFGHHGWTVLVLNGTEYIFDAQRDARNWQYHGWNGYYFGIAPANTGSYYPNYAAADRTANPQRDASMLPMTADREIASAHAWYTVVVNATCTETGTKNSTCKLCGKTKTETIAALGHHWNSGVMTTPMTEYDDGIAAFTCTRCGAVYTITIPAGGSPFIDVQDADAYFYEPVLWAVDQEITYGMDASHFVPSGACTRAQAVAFLYRIAGEPDVSGKENPFADVKEDSWYYEAVLWGYDSGVVCGTAEDTFSPNDTVTRAQFVTLLYRYAGETETADTEIPFRDVSAESYYWDAVAWGYQNGIIAGRTADRFAPEDNCTRGEVATFLRRADQADAFRKELPDSDADTMDHESDSEA